MVPHQLQHQGDSCSEQGSVRVLCTTGNKVDSPLDTRVGVGKVTHCGTDGLCVHGDGSSVGDSGRVGDGDTECTIEQSRHFLFVRYSFTTTRFLSNKVSVWTVVRLL